MNYNDCWGYPKEEIDKIFKNVEEMVSSITAESLLPKMPSGKTTYLKSNGSKLSWAEMSSILKKKTFEYGEKTTFAKGDYGYVDITLTDIPATATIVSIIPYVTHMAAATQLTGATDANNQHLYLAYYAPTAFSNDNFKIMADIIYY